jgi:hypothetical protein
MKFVTNRISVGAGKKNFAQLAEEILANKNGGMKKQASADENVKVARSDPKQEEGKSSGQLDVEPLHQKGESTPKVEHKTGDEDQGVKDKVVSSQKPGQKKEAESSCCDKDNENNGPAEESGQTKADFPKLTNDPEAGKHRDGDGDQKKTAAGLDNFGDKKAQPFGAKKEDDKKEDDKKDEKVAQAKRKFVRLANLDSKSKKWLKDYWGKIYMPEYADAMTADK